MMNELGHAEVEVETLDTPTLVTELIMMQFRLVEGLSLASLSRHTGLDALELLDPALTRLVEQGLLTVSATHIALTGKGRLLADAVIAELLGAYQEDAKPQR